MPVPFDPTTLAPAPGADIFHLTVEPFPTDHLRVESWSGHEALSEPYAFDVVTTIATEADEEIERLALGHRASFVWTTAKGERAFYGVIAAVRLERVHAAGTRRVQVHLRVVPRLWLLKRRKRTRIFQQMRAPDIIEAVLKSAGIGARWQLLRDHPVREHCTQYEESDLRFVQRLAAEAGIFFYFPEGPPLDGAAGDDAVIPGDTVVFADDASLYPHIGGEDLSALADSPAIAAAPAPAAEAPPLYFFDMEGSTTSHHDKITRFSARTVVKADAAAYRDHDPERPAARPGSVATSTHPFPAGDDPAAPAQAAFGLEVYEHHSPFLFPSWGWAAEEAALILRQKRRRASQAHGEGGCPELSPGHRFTLADHPAGHLDRAWVVTRVEHRGHAHADAHQKVYWNHFAAVPAEVAFVPARPKRKPVQVALTATVVGPPGEEIHVDAAGRIKLQFHWDREGGMDDRSSCWIRVMQAWAGAGFGSQFIPRVGQEVVVTFEGGDPDKPIVLGAVYNGTHPPPFLLPGDKTRSGIKTQSSPGGAGSNEISFEDAAGQEQLYTHAARDQDEVVERNHTQLVRGDERLRVLGSRVDIVEEDRISRVARNVEEMVGGDQSTQVEGNRVDVVTGNHDERVSGALVTRVEGRERRDVKRNVDLELAEDFTTRVLGCMTTLVGRDDARRSWVTHAEGLAKLSSLETTEISSEGELVLRVGKSCIRITSEKVEIDSPAVTVKGTGGGLSADDEGLRLGSKKDAVFTVEKKIVIKSTEGASLSMEREVKIDGKQILLNSPANAEDPPPKDPEPPTKIELVDQESGVGLGYQRFLVAMDDGSEVSGTLDKDGKAEASLKSSGKITFPDVTMPGDTSGMDDLRPYVVRQGDFLARLAWIGGFDAEAVWGHAKNQELAALRKDHNVLAPGDVLHLPVTKKVGLPVEKGGENRYEAKVPRVDVCVRLRRGRMILRDEPYFVEGLPSASTSRTTDEDGGLTLKVPVTTREVVVVLPERKLRFPLYLGGLDPLSQDSGRRQRLSNLGHYRVRDWGQDAAAAFARAVRYFQAERGMQVTGEMDDSTRDELGRGHGR